MPSKFPFIPNELLAELDKRYPERVPEPDWTERQIWMAVGARQLVRFLHAQAKIQLEEQLKNTSR